MARSPIRLGMLARALSDTGQRALAAGVELRSISLSVAVSAPPMLDPQQLWPLRVAAPARPWRQWLGGWLGQWLGQHPNWPRVELVWEDGAVFARLQHQEIDQ